LAAVLVIGFPSFASAAVRSLPLPASVHRVAAGETPATIAAEEHVSLADLARINELSGGASALPAGTLLALDDEALPLVNERQAYAAPPEARVELQSMEIASNMPTANADIRMWAANDSAPAALSGADADKKSDAIHRFARGIISRTSAIAMSLTRSAMRFIGTPYVFGGTSTSGFDCSGYVQHVFALLGIALPRTADAQYYAGRPPAGGIRIGDLVFFQTYLPGPSHVGIYIGRGKFIHSSSHGVMVSRLADSYWSSRYLGAKRFVALR
jgi:cell wall-associated NlpC family hydrolase